MWRLTRLTTWYSEPHVWLLFRLNFFTEILLLCSTSKIHHSVFKFGVGLSLNWRQFSTGKQGCEIGFRKINRNIFNQTATPPYVYQNMQEIKPGTIDSMAWTWFVFSFDFMIHLNYLIFITNIFPRATTFPPLFITMFVQFLQSFQNAASFLIWNDPR